MEVAGREGKRERGRERQGERRVQKMLIAEVFANVKKYREHNCPSGLKWQVNWLSKDKQLKLNN